MKNIKNTVASILAVGLFPALGLAQTEPNISENIDKVERLVADAKQTLTDLGAEVDVAVKVTSELTRAVEFGRVNHGLALRIEQQIQSARYLSGKLTEFRRQTAGIRVMVEDLERRAENADSTIKARVEKLADSAKRLDSDSAGMDSTLRGVQFKLAELKEKVSGGSGFGVGH